MEHHYTRPNYRSPLIATDTIIRPKDDPASGVVLIDRKNLPHGIAIPGGMAEHGLTLVQNARKESKEETDLDVIIDTPGRPYYESSNPSRDGRDHVISIVYTGIGKGEPKGGDDAKSARLYSVPELKELIFYRQLAFDHGDILALYLKENGLLVDASREHFSRIGLIGRFQPPHEGHLSLLRKSADVADKVIVGIGSVNRHDAQNPFTAEETATMIRGAFDGNYSFRFIKDYALEEQHRSGQRWVEEIRKQFGELDAFVTGNPYVANLLAPHYRILHPVELFGQQERPRLRSSEIRERMVDGDDFRSGLPSSVAHYLDEHRLVERFRKEFGESVRNAYHGAATVDQERARAEGGDA